jgi:hypothetical protein
MSQSSCRSIRFVRQRTARRAGNTSRSSWVRTYASSEIASRELCGQRGSTLFWSRSQGEFADWISIALGTLDTPFIPQTQKHVHIESAAPWWRHPAHARRSADHVGSKAVRRHQPPSIPGRRLIALRRTALTEPDPYQVRRKHQPKGSCESPKFAPINR